MKNEKVVCYSKHCMGILHCPDYRRRNHSTVTAYFSTSLILHEESCSFCGAVFFFFCYNSNEFNKSLVGEPVWPVEKAFGEMLTL